MSLISKLFRKQKPPFVVEWISSDLDAYAANYPVHDPLVVSSALDYVCVYFLTLGAEFPERGREFLYQLNDDDQETDRMLDQVEVSPGTKQAESLVEISARMYGLHIKRTCEWYLGVKGRTVNHGEDPVALAFKVGLDREAVFVTFIAVATNMIIGGYIMPLGVSELVDEFLKSVSERTSALRDLMPVALQTRAETTIKDAAAVRADLEQQLTTYDSI